MTFHDLYAPCHIHNFLSFYYYLHISFIHVLLYRTVCHAHITVTHATVIYAWSILLTEYGNVYANIKQMYCTIYRKNKSTVKTNISSTSHHIQ